MNQLIYARCRKSWHTACPKNYNILIACEPVFVKVLLQIGILFYHSLRIH